MIVFRNYGEPIEARAIDNLGRPTTIILTESTIQSTRWERIQSAVSEYTDAAVQVLKDTF